MGDYNRVFFVCPALDSINVDGLNEYLHLPQGRVVEVAGVEPAS